MFIRLVLTNALILAKLARKKPFMGYIYYIL